MNDFYSETYAKWINNQDILRPKDIHDYSSLSVFKDLNECFILINKLKDKFLKEEYNV